MKRQPHPWFLADTDQVLDQGERLTHNAALSAGTEAVRTVARGEGQTYTRTAADRREDVTVVHWIGDRTGRELVVTVRRTAS